MPPSSSPSSALPSISLKSMPVRLTNRDDAKSVQKFAEKNYSENNEKNERRTSSEKSRTYLNVLKMLHTFRR